MGYYEDKVATWATKVELAEGADLTDLIQWAKKWGKAHRQAMRLGAHHAEPYGVIVTHTGKVAGEVALTKNGGFTLAKGTKKNLGIRPMAFDRALSAVSRAVGEKVVWVRGVDLASGAAIKPRLEDSNPPAVVRLRQAQMKLYAADKERDKAQAELNEQIRLAHDEAGESLRSIAAALEMSAMSAKRYYEQGRTAHENRTSD